jgi:hypothetical protein
MFQPLTDAQVKALSYLLANSEKDFYFVMSVHQSPEGNLYYYIEYENGNKDTNPTGIDKEGRFFPVLVVPQDLVKLDILPDDDIDPESELKRIFG